MNAATTIGFLYRCPVSGLRVQGWANEPHTTEDEDSEYVALRCPVCSRTHLVSPKSGHVLGDERKPDPK
jgi:hypothetical protein